MNALQLAARLGRLGISRAPRPMVRALVAASVFLLQISSLAIFENFMLRATYHFFLKNSPDLDVSENRSRKFRKIFGTFSSKNIFLRKIKLTYPKSQIQFGKLPNQFGKKIHWMPVADYERMF